eukprot:gene19570-biopygen961
MGKGGGGWFHPPPVPWREPIRRGEALLMRGYAATCVTHCVRAPDVPGRRIAIIVRIVRRGAPIATAGECVRPRAPPRPRPARGGEERAPWERDDRRGAPRGGKGAPAA